ncbi:hypothetical protein NOJ28_14695 [Neorhizobium galegae]|uniref:hypothetical protein n=1 Tax=Neorhizobium galegae TaxID=399 RepID=UPI002107562E|nr:hypothetical protein [Neorhizobium galegae]MCQ1766787.1 hypothetical protein [Neorhizobium galegae]MCQ1849410.1 hypothetical protein [Neorhizobium galegae]
MTASDIHACECAVMEPPEDGSYQGFEMNKQVEDEWNGWDGDTVVKLTDGSIWRQEEYHYEYRYSYRPQVRITGNMMHVDGMSRAIRVRRID